MRVPIVVVTLIAQWTAQLVTPAIKRSQGGRYAKTIDRDQGSKVNAPNQVA
ncbi:hypothetical protein [Gemmatimonas aurantiaca]|uniref:hypothetical protein n=1 Tax=Gemmatimonas aurantiaca TaxID=173480 RepID=UPI00301B705F